MVPIMVRYDLEIVATLYFLPECPYVHLKHFEFLILLITILCDIIILFIYFLNSYSYYYKLQCYKRCIFDSLQSSSFQANFSKYCLIFLHLYYAYSVLTLY